MTNDEWYIVEHLSKIVEDEKTLTWLGDLMFTDKTLNDSDRDKLLRLQIKYMEYGNEKTRNA